MQCTIQIENILRFTIKRHQTKMIVKMYLILNNIYIYFQIKGLENVFFLNFVR